MLGALSDCYKLVMVNLHCQSPWKHILGVCEGEPSIGLASSQTEYEEENSLRVHLHSSS